MNFKNLIAGRHAVVWGVLTAGLLLLAVDPSPASDQFPFDQELMLDAAPMRPAKRMPAMTVAADGNATFDLWCRTVPARVEFSDSAIRVEPGPLPDGLPQYMSAGQCSEQRQRADEEMLAALAQVTAWRREGRALVLDGVMRMRFRPASN